MSGERLPGKTQAQLPFWLFISGETLTPDGSTAVTIPSTATAFIIAAETAAIYYYINNAFAGTDAPGYVAADGAQVVGPIGNLTSLAIYGDGTGIAHIQFFREG